MYGYIYETTNLINGKKYIGQKKSNIFLGNNHASGKRTVKQKKFISEATKKAMSKIEWCYVHTEAKNVRIKKENLEHYLSLGYIKGKR